MSKCRQVLDWDASFPILEPYIESCTRLDQSQYNDLQTLLHLEMLMSYVLRISSPLISSSFALVLFPLVMRCPSSAELTKATPVFISTMQPLSLMCWPKPTSKAESS